MKNSNLEKAGIYLTPLALGCEPLGATDCGHVNMSELHAAVNMAWEMGIRVFDTADVYGLGRSERQLSKALGGKRHEAVIVSKFGCRWDTKMDKKRVKVHKDASPEYVRLALESSLKRLDIEAIPIYLVHWPDINTPLEDTLEALEVFKKEGKILAYGLSNFSWSQCEKVLSQYSIAAIEGQYSLISQECSKTEYANARNAGVETLTYGPLAQGLLSGKYTENSTFGTDDRRHRLPQFSMDAWPRNKKLLKVLFQASEAHGKTPSQVALRWIIEQNIVSSLIIGAKNSAQVEANIGALGWQLDPLWSKKLSDMANSF